MAHSTREHEATVREACEPTLGEGDPSCTPQIVVRIPFPCARHASLAFCTLSVDPEPPRSRVSRHLSVESLRGLPLKPGASGALAVAANMGQSSGGGEGPAKSSGEGKEPVKSTGDELGPSVGEGGVLVARFTALRESQMAARAGGRAPVGGRKRAAGAQGNIKKGCEESDRLDMQMKALKVSLNAFLEQCELVAKTIHTFAPSTP